MNVEEVMARCRELGERAKSNGFAPVGALLIINNHVVAEASEMGPSDEFPFGHAEMFVVEASIRRVGFEQMRKAILFTSHEPCVMCAYAIREAGVREVYIGVSVGDIGGANGTFPILRTREIEHWGPPPRIVFLGDDFESE